MKVEAVHVHTRGQTQSPFTHVIVCGSTEAAINIALTLRRLGEAVTLLADDVGAETRQLLEGAGVLIVIGVPGNSAAMGAARAERARAMVIAVPSDLGCIEVALAAGATHPDLPLVCYVNDAELAVRIERSLGVRSAVCVSNIQSVHLAGCALGTDVIGAFALADDLVLVRRTSVTSDQQDTVGQFQSRTGTRVLMVEESDGRCVIGPPLAIPLSTGSVVTAIHHRADRTANPLLLRLLIASAHSWRVIRSSTPRALGWTITALTLLAAASIFVFMWGMKISFVDAAYLVLNTITTVGYGDITPLGSGRFMLIFGSFVALLGPALLGALLLTFARLVLRPSHRVSPERGHVVFIAPPTIAASAASYLARLSIGTAIAVPQDPSAWATTTRIDGLLRETNACAAAALVAATNDPVTNVTFGLAARELNPSIHVVLGGPAKLAAGMRMTTPASAVATSIALASSAVLVAGLRYAVTMNDRVFSFFEGAAAAEWSGLRPSEVAASYNFLTLFRRTVRGRWTAAIEDTPFAEDENILVVAWRRFGPVNPGN